MGDVCDYTPNTRKVNWDFRNTYSTEWRNKIVNTFKDWSNDLPADVCNSFTYTSIKCASDKAKKLWWRLFCNQVNSDDNEFWKTINKVMNG